MAELNELTKRLLSEGWGTEIKVKPGTADHRVIIFRLPADPLEGHIAISKTAAFHQQTAWRLKRQGGEDGVCR